MFFRGNHDGIAPIPPRALGRQRAAHGGSATRCGSHGRRPQYGQAVTCPACLGDIASELGRNPCSYGATTTVLPLSPLWHWDVRGRHTVEVLHGAAVMADGRSMGRRLRAQLVLAILQVSWGETRALTGQPRRYCPYPPSGVGTSEGGTRWKCYTVR